MCLNGELPWAIHQVAAYIHTCHLSLNRLQTERERDKNIHVLSCGITCLNDMLHKYVWRTEVLMSSGVLNRCLNKKTIHEANILLMKMCLNCLKMKIQ